LVPCTYKEDYELRTEATETILAFAKGNGKVAFDLASAIVSDEVPVEYIEDILVNIIPALEVKEERLINAILLMTQQLEHTDDKLAAIKALEKLAFTRKQNPNLFMKVIRLLVEVQFHPDMDYRCSVDALQAFIGDDDKMRHKLISELLGKRVLPWTDKRATKAWKTRVSTFKGTKDELIEDLVEDFKPF